MVAAGQDQLARVRASTDKFHTLSVAENAGYGEFYLCTDHVTDGTMGQHYVNLDLVLDTGSARHRPAAARGARLRAEEERRLQAGRRRVRRVPGGVGCRE